MKAYEVYSDYSEGNKIVFAETANKARAIAAHSDGFEDEEYKDIRAYRLPLLDGMENFEPKDNYWLNEQIRKILVRDYGWQCIEPNVYDPCAECCAKEYCGYWESIKEEST